MDNSTCEKKLQEQIKPASIGQVGIDYKPMDWRGKRARQYAIARIADTAGLTIRGDKYAACGTSLTFGINGTGRHLSSANFCRQRLCPICTARAAQINARRLAKVLCAAQERVPGCRYIFVTLSARNVSPSDLATGIDTILAGWRKLNRTARIRRSVLGSYRALEVTRNRKDNTYHPHIHAIYCVSGSYFKKNKTIYIPQDELVILWQRALGVSYAPTAHISALYAKADGTQQQRRNMDTWDAVREAAKYTVKDQDIMQGSLADQADTYLRMMSALGHRRCAGYSGVLQDVARALRVDKPGDITQADLVGADEDDSAIKLAYDIMEYWAWHDAAQDYVCEAVEIVQP